MRLLHTLTHLHTVPVSEGGSPAKQNCFGFGLWLIEQTEEGMVLHTALPEDFALITASHQELQRVLMRTLNDRQRDTQS